MRHWQRWARAGASSCGCPCSTRRQVRPFLACLRALGVARGACRVAAWAWPPGACCVCGGRGWAVAGRHCKCVRPRCVPQQMARQPCWVSRAEHGGVQAPAPCSCICCWSRSHQPAHFTQTCRARQQLCQPGAHLEPADGRGPQEVWRLGAPGWPGELAEVVFTSHDVFHVRTRSAGGLAAQCPRCAR